MALVAVTANKAEAKDVHFPITASYSCETEDDETLSNFKLELKHVAYNSSLEYAPLALIKASDGSILKGSFSVYPGKEGTRLAGLTHYIVNTKGDLGSVRLNLLISGALSGNGVISSEDGEKMILVSCQLNAPVVVGITSLANDICNRPHCSLRLCGKCGE